jgi:predicted enzyme related to lactoylglutathione lyase
MSEDSQGDEPAMTLSSVYVGVKDMDRALAFYRSVFGVDPEQAEERFSTFTVRPVDFGLYDAEYDGHEFTFGDNCVPNFEVDDVESAHERIETLAPELVHDDILEFGDYRTFQFVDTEGNTIEVFSIESG